MDDLNEYMYSVRSQFYALCDSENTALQTTLWRTICEDPISFWRSHLLVVVITRTSSMYGFRIPVDVEELCTLTQSAIANQNRKYVDLSCPSQMLTAFQVVDVNSLKAAFREPYKGVAAQALYEALTIDNRYFKFNRYYGKFKAYVQASGSGKTRTSMELSQLGVFVLHINLRSPSDTMNWPPRDGILADILLDPKVQDAE
ncbi:hypothetical protein QCA50_008302 [Cerrena zonata]|uniref:Uncharacterized protein n=1 Tax=Cerrena zonata TaxID=2478898 RepID=A0AAW0G515_9APHY